MKYKVKLTASQRFDLVELVNKGKEKARKLTHARILLQADYSKEGPALKAKIIAQNLNIHERTVHRVRQKFANEGLSVALNRKEHTHYKPRRLDGVQEVKLIAICCGSSPKGRVGWTLELLADQLVKLNIVDSLSKSTVQRTLKK
ncbi:hypothetical protein AB835_12620 [Candidatus Endobugula sertula]|uniref:Transposase n=1 Tax=Candidatus Endobugula sertula TaxID=62101 RepID=A0A1D2QME7_9GAMM|nr:hypothetical protein AB835_12620 [Candidatus Endobugula sertula]